MRRRKQCQRYPSPEREIGISTCESRGSEDVWSKECQQNAGERGEVLVFALLRVSHPGECGVVQTDKGEVRREGFWKSFSKKPMDVSIERKLEWVLTDVLRTCGLVRYVFAYCQLGISGYETPTRLPLVM